MLIRLPTVGTIIVQDPIAISVRLRSLAQNYCSFTVQLTARQDLSEFAAIPIYECNYCFKLSLKVQVIQF